MLPLHHRDIGRSSRIRTYDPLVPNQMRYQTALHSVVWCPLTESNCQLMITNQLLYHLTKGALVAGDRIELSTEAYETSEIPFL